MVSLQIAHARREYVGIASAPTIAGEGANAKDTYNRSRDRVARAAMQKMTIELTIHASGPGAPMSLLPMELLRLSSAQTNLLLEGEASQVETVLTAVAPSLPRPVTTWGGTGSLAAVRDGTLIVPLVNRFDDDQQRQLLRWLEETAGAVRVIATTRGSLFRLVQRGIFLDALYYRLNTIRVEIAA
jgi:hypothetical protein